MHEIRARGAALEACTISEPEEQPRVHESSGCAMCVKCGAYQYYNTTVKGGCKCKDNCGTGSTLHKRIRKEKAEEKWTVDDMWRLRLGLQLT